jgi:hypothetical protein
VGLLTATQTTDLLSRLPQNMETLLGSPRFAQTPASTGRAGSQLASSARTRLHPATARSARGAPDRFAAICSSARAAAAVSSVRSNTAGAGAASQAAASVSSVCTAGAVPTAAAGPASARAHTYRHGSAVSSANSRRPGSASTGQHGVQPQPSRDEWRAVAASCLTQRHATKVRSARSPQQSATCKRGCGHVAALALVAQQHTGVLSAPPSISPVSAAAAAAAAKGSGPVGRARQWEYAGASLASAEKRTQRAGIDAVSSAGATAQHAGVLRSPGRRRSSLAACYGVHHSSSGSGQLTQQPAAAAGGMHRPAAMASSAAAANRAELPPPSNDNISLFTPGSPGRMLKPGSPGFGSRAAAAAAAGAGALNSPRVARQAASAAAAGGGTQRAASSPMRMQDRGDVSRSLLQVAATAIGAAATPRCTTQQQQQRSGGRDRQSNSSSSSSDARGQCDTSKVGRGRTPGHDDSITAAVAAASVAVRQPGNVLDASCKYLLSACAVPPAALLSPKYVGPVEAAVIRAHSPKRRG